MLWKYAVGTNPIRWMLVIWGNVTQELVDCRNNLIALDLRMTETVLITKLKIKIQ